MPLSAEQIKIQLASQAMRLRALEKSVARLDPEFRVGIFAATAESPVAVPPVIIHHEPFPVPIVTDIAPSVDMTHPEPPIAETIPMAVAVEPELTEPVVPPAPMQTPPQHDLNFSIPQEILQRAEAEPPDSEPKPTLSAEQKIGSSWLLRIGGVLLLIGAALGAAQINSIMGPGGRVAAAFVAAAILAGAGQWLKRRNEVAGRTMQVIALALGYFTAYASGYIKATTVFPRTLILIPVGMMVAFGGAIVAAAERWRSEITAMFGFMLAMVAVLVSANSQGGETFAIIAVGVICLSAGILLLRNQWVRLTLFVLIGAYATLPLTWWVSRLPSTPEAFFQNVAAILTYHLLFAAAFWRWGRVWIAREEMFERELAAGTIPSDSRLPELPYSRAFAIINSLALVALVSFLVQRSEYSHSAHYFYFALAALEFGRLAIRGFRRGGLVVFHMMLASSLVTAAIMSATNGLAQSFILALQTLVLVIAGTRSSSLRWLCGLSGLTALLSLVQFAIHPIVTPGDLAAGLLTPLALLISVMPWERFFVANPAEHKIVLVYAVAQIGKLLRDLCGTLTLAFAITHYVMPSAAEMPSWIAAVAYCALALTFLGGGLWLRFRAWLLPAAICTFMVFFHLAIAHKLILPTSLFLILAIGLLSAGWDATERQLKNRVLKVFCALGWVLHTMAAGAVIVVMMLVHTRIFDLGGGTRELEGNATYLLIGCAVAALVARLVMRKNIISFQTEEDVVVEPAGRVSLSFFMLVASTVGSVIISLLESVNNPTGAGIISIISLALWVWNVRRKGSDAASVVLSLLGLLIGSSGMLIYTHLSQVTLLALVMLGMGFVVASLRFRHATSTVVGSFFIMALTICALVALGNEDHTMQTQVLSALVTSLVVLIGSHLLARAGAEQTWSKSLRDCIHALNAVNSSAAIILALVQLSPYAQLVPAWITTASWGVFASLLLIFGFVLRSKTIRMWALVTYALAVGRVFLYDFDIASSNPTGKIIAFLGLGGMLIGAGFVYSALSRKFLSDERAPKVEDKKE